MLAIDFATYCRVCVSILPIESCDLTCRIFPQAGGLYGYKLESLSYHSHNHNSPPYGSPLRLKPLSYEQTNITNLDHLIKYQNIQISFSFGFNKHLSTSRQASKRNMSHKEFLNQLILILLRYRNGRKPISYRKVTFLSGVEAGK